MRLFLHFCEHRQMFLVCLDPRQLKHNFCFSTNIQRCCTGLLLKHSHFHNWWLGEQSGQTGVGFVAKAAGTVCTEKTLEPLEVVCCFGFLWGSASAKTWPKTSWYALLILSRISPAGWTLQNVHQRQGPTLSTHFRYRGTGSRLKTLFNVWDEFKSVTNLCKLFLSRFTRGPWVIESRWALTTICFWPNLLCRVSIAWFIPSDDVVTIKRCFIAPRGLSCTHIYQVFTVPFTLKAASSMGVCSLDDPWSFVASNSLMHSIQLMYLEVIAVLHYNNHDGVIHARVLKSLYFIKVQ